MVIFAGRGRMATETSHAEAWSAPSDKVPKPSKFLFMDDIYLLTLKVCWIPNPAFSFLGAVYVCVSGCHIF
jgi:hypothetical protein